MIKAIDTSINAFFPETSSRFSDLGLWKFLDDNPAFEGISGESWAEKIKRGWSPASIIEKMDTADIEKGFLISPWVTDGVGGKDMVTTVEEVAVVIDEYPDKFFGLVGVNPLNGMETIRYIDRAVNTHNFKGVHIYPHWFGLPVNDKKYYPIYSKCVELDIPICMQISMQTPASGAAFCGQPRFLDSVALDFPELRIVALHTGHPFEDELIAMCWVHENIYQIVDAFRPTMWPPTLVNYICTVGQDRVMWGSDFPIQEDLAMSVREVNEVIKDENIRRKILRDNAIKCFKL